MQGEHNTSIVAACIVVITVVRTKLDILNETVKYAT